MFEVPNLETSQDSENKEETSDPLLSTMGKTIDRNAFLERIDKLMEEKLTALEIYG
jgi:hypothetical protein